MSFEDKLVGPKEMEMPDLFGSNPIGERTAFDAVHHYVLVRVHLESSPVTEVRPPSRGCFVSACPIGIVIGKLRRTTNRQLYRHVSIGLVEDQT